MDLQEKVSDQLLNGHGIRLISDNELVHSVGRKAALTAALKPQMDALALTAGDSQTKSETATQEIATLTIELDAFKAVPIPVKPVPVDAEALTEAEEIAEADYQAAVISRESPITLHQIKLIKKIEVANNHLADKATALAKISPLQIRIDSAAEDPRLHRGAKAIVCNILTKFLVKQFNASIKDEACTLITEYLNEFPNATLVPVKSFEGLDEFGDPFIFPTQVVDADSLEVIAAYTTVRIQ